MKKETKHIVWESVKKGLIELFTTCNYFNVIILASLLSCSVVLLDYFNVPSLALSSISKDVIFLLAGTIAVIVVTWLLKIHALDLVMIISANPLDTAIMVVGITSFLYSIIRSQIMGHYIYTIIAQRIALGAGSILLIRCIIRCVFYIQTMHKQSNLEDLKAIYENNFSRQEGMPILIAEKDVDYDLLNRGGTIYRLYHSIVHCQPEQSYVMSLEGSWGAGKTTIINQTKRMLRENKDIKNDLLIIDDFDPWLYGTQEALLLSMLETIMNHTDMKYSPVKSKKLMESISKAITESHPAASLIGKLFYNVKDHGEDVARLKKSIGTYLNVNRKTIVFFIDNLDRTNDKNIVFLFKLISIVFDLPGIVYVLSFERDRIDAVLKNTCEIDPRFTEKIIQQEIRVPTISTEKANELYSVCMMNMLSAYGVTEIEMSQFAEVIRYIIGHTPNVRTFKRMLNSVFATALSNDTLLYKRDLLAIEAIRFYDPILHAEIYRNAKYFVSHAKSPEMSLEIGFDKDRFNKAGTEFYSKLFEIHMDAKELLAEMFPYANRYIHCRFLEYNMQGADSDATEIAKQSRICNGLFFDLYFSHSSNIHLSIRKKVEEFVVRINASTDINSIKKIINDTLIDNPQEEQSEWIETLQINVCDIDQQRAFGLAVGLYSQIFCISKDRSGFDFKLSPRVRAEYIISELLLKCDEQEFYEFQKKTIEDYGRLSVLYSICKWLSSERNNSGKPKQERAMALTAHLVKICTSVICDRINIYSNAMYHKGNAWGLYHSLNDRNDAASFKAYIKSVISADNIYRVIWDTATCAISDNYRYSIDKESFGLFFECREMVDKLLAERSPQNASEEYVQKLYDRFRYGEADEWGYKGLVSSTSVSLDL